MPCKSTLNMDNVNVNHLVDLKKLGETDWLSNDSIISLPFYLICEWYKKSIHLNNTRNFGTETAHECEDIR